MAKLYGLSPGSAGRLARALRKFEQTPTDLTRPIVRPRILEARTICNFSGICKVDELNPDTAYPGSGIAYNEYGPGGIPKTGEREWLLLKCEGPFQSSTGTDPGQEPHFPMHLYNVTMNGALKLWWEYYLITENFYVADDAEADPPQVCATWESAQELSMNWGTDGLIDFSQGISVFMATADRHLSCCYPGFGYERTVYGICLRPYLLANGGDSDWRVDYRKWFVRL